MFKTMLSTNLVRPLTRSFYIYTKNRNRRTIRQYIRSLWAAKSPPYKHVVQIGDPTLREVCREIPRDDITKPDCQKLIARMLKVMRSRGLWSLSAPQIGIPKRVIVAEQTADYVNGSSKADVERLGIHEVPLKVFVNPKMEVLDDTVVTETEGCYSVHSYVASVARYKAVRLRGFDAKSEPCEWVATGWQARVVQHELDHLDGILFVDKMKPRSLHDEKWALYNDQGRIFW